VRNSQRNKRSAINTHHALHEKGIASSSKATLSASIPPCCKLWFPLNETGSPAVFTDAVAGLTITPDVQTQNEEGSWELSMHDGLVGRAPTSGTVPTLDDNDFILFTAYKVKTEAYRTLNLIRLGANSGDSLSIQDGDAFQIWKDGVVDASANTWGGALTAGMKGGIATVRIGGKIGFWMYCPDGDKTVKNNGTGDTYQEYKDGNSVWCRRCDEATPTCEYPEGEPNPDLEGVDCGDIQGKWKCYTAGALDLDNFVQLNVNGDYGQNAFGYALFEFADGLPIDWETGLRWMTDAWVDDLNKVIFPGWITLL